MSDTPSRESEREKGGKEGGRREYGEIGGRGLGERWRMGGRERERERVKIVTLMIKWVGVEWLGLRREKRKQNSSQRQGRGL